MADEAAEIAWRIFLDAIAEADFLAEEIANCDPGSPRRHGLIAAWHAACRRRDDAREMLRGLMGWK